MFPMIGPLMSLCTTNIAFGVSLANNSNPDKNMTARKMNRISSSLPQVTLGSMASKALVLT
jgi:hypothetical protein